MQDQELVLKTAKILDEKKAKDIIALDVRKLTVICDYMVIASGRNTNQVRALADEVDDLLAQEGMQLRRSEGMNEARWIVLDYGTLLVHLFHQDDRAYYNLERLWEDGTNRIALPLEGEAEE